MLNSISFGVFKSKKLPQGIKQGPAIYQNLQDTAFDTEFNPNGEKLRNVFFDDTHMGDHNVEEHIATLARVLTVAREYNIQYRLVKCHFFQLEVSLMGFVCSKQGRRVDPKKVQQLQDWPEYKCAKDIGSHLAFANYLREFFGPDFSEKVKPLRYYQKKDADFATYATDREAVAEAILAGV